MGTSREVDIMKKFAKVMALVLAGAMLLMMTACCGTLPTDETAARELILKEINDYREEIHKKPLVEEELLIERENIYAECFEKAGKTTLTYDEIDWAAMKENLEKITEKDSLLKPYTSVGTANYTDADGNACYVLSCKFSSLPELRAQIRAAYEFVLDFVEKIGISVIKVDKDVYWQCQLWYYNMD